MHQVRSAVRCSGESHEGWAASLPRTACEADLRMDDSFNEFTDMGGGGVFQPNTHGDG